MTTVKIKALLLHNDYYTFIFSLSAVVTFVTCHDNLLLALPLFLLIQGVLQYPLIEGGEIFPWFQRTLDQISYFLELPHPLRPQLSHFVLDNIVFRNWYFFTLRNQTFLLVDESDASSIIYIMFSKPTGVKQIWKPPRDWLSWWV